MSKFTENADFVVVVVVCLCCLAVHGRVSAETYNNGTSSRGQAKLLKALC